MNVTGMQYVPVLMMLAKEGRVIGFDGARTLANGINRLQEALADSEKLRTELAECREELERCKAVSADWEKAARSPVEGLEENIRLMWEEAKAAGITEGLE